MKKNYNIGLDIGTSSVGWAVVNNETNKIYKQGEKQLWGVRLFEEAQKAENRRTARSTRRRYDRRRKRIKLLQNEFSAEIAKVDPDFYKKLKESMYTSDDVSNKTIAITKEENKKIKEYNKEFPTIYHLRNYLINSNEKVDIRLVYLAIHHIIKYRGNFLYSNESFSVSSLNIKEKIKESFESLLELSNIDFDIDLIDFGELEKALLVESKKDKEVLVTNVLNAAFDSTFVKEFIKMIKGNEFDIKKLLNLEDAESIKTKFSGTVYEEKCSDIESQIGDQIEIINEFKELNDMLYLKSLFKGQDVTSLSELMVNKYDIHKEDLNFLKKLFRYKSKNEDIKIFDVRHNEYKNMFKSNEKKEFVCIYDKYIHNSISYDDFKKALNKSIEKIMTLGVSKDLEDEYNNKYKERIENGDFLPRITSTDNGKFPYQLNKDELIKIIENQGKYYPFLLDKITLENGKEVYKLVRLLEFKIPYYVGPLNTTTNQKGVDNENAWIKLKVKNCNITPYNFEEVIDKEATAEEFIKRMISHCTYLLREYAIPANSILYSEFKVRNELKQIKVGNRRLSQDVQEKIYNELFLKTDKVITEKMFKNYLIEYKIVPLDSNPEIKGYSADKKFANNMKPYVDFFGKNGIFINTSYRVSDAEQIIEWCTIFEDKSILIKKIKDNYKELNEQAIDKILQKKYKGWSNLSEKLLTDIYYEEKGSGLKKSIMDLMRETNLNFMQIITKKEYDFQTKFDKENHIEKLDKLDYSVVKDLATSPGTKRGIYQALKIVEEIVEYIGNEPANIMIEMARGEDKEKKRTDSKKEYLVKLYNECKKNIDNYNSLKKELDSVEKITSRRMFLYFIQEGKCLYSGKPLNLSEIENNDKYEVDHIIPRTLIKDNSIDNLALVYREENQDKKDSVVVPVEIRNKMYGWWNRLKDKKLISAKKFHNLTREKYSDEDIEGFINRQLVETRQISKHVANILKTYYKDTNIIYLNANLSSNYRDKYDLIKFRDINDYHHAHDAYLAVMLGKYKEYYLKTVDFSKLKELTHEWIKEKKYDNLKYGYVINSMEIEIRNSNNDVTYNPEQYNKLIEDTLYRNDIIVTQKTEIRTGEFYQETKNKKGQKGVPLKKNMPTNKYGSYTRIKPAFASIINFEKKNKTQQKMIGIPIYVESQLKSHPEVKDEYIRNTLGLTDSDTYTIVRDKIPFNSIFDWNGQICALVGASDKVEVCNAKEFQFSKKEMQKWKHILNKILNDKNLNEELNDDEYTHQLDNILNYILKKIEKEYKLYENLLPELRAKIILGDLDIETKEIVIKELFKLLKFNSTNANLSCLGLSKYYGKKHGRTIFETKIISTSVTGLKSRTEDITFEENGQ